MKIIRAAGKIAFGDDPNRRKAYATKWCQYVITDKLEIKIPAQNFGQLCGNMGKFKAVLW